MEAASREERFAKELEAGDETGVTFSLDVIVPINETLDRENRQRNRYLEILKSASDIAEFGIVGRTLELVRSGQSWPHKIEINWSDEYIFISKPQFSISNI